MSDESQGVGWWVASDGKWYAPELHPSTLKAPVDPPSPAPGDSALVAPSTGDWDASGLTRPGPVWTHESIDLATPYGGVGRPGWSPLTGDSAAQNIGVRHRRVSRRAIVTGALITAAVVALIGDLVVALGSTAPAYPATWNPRVLGIVHFVEHERGLSPVQVEFLDNAKFDQAVSVPQPHSASDRASLTRELEELRALGLVHGNVNLAQSENELQQSDVVGLYVPQKKAVFVRGSSLTPFVRVTLAHELTHALQDQYFDLTQLRSTTPGDGSAVTALIEGDAVRVQNAYERSLSAADQHSYEKASARYQGSSSQSSNVPAILSDTLEYPYAFGPTFIDNLVARGGTGAIDNAFRHPPVAQAQIVDPDAYPIGWKPAKVSPPSVPRGDRVTDPASPFGQITLFEVLGSRLGYGPAWNAVQGWQGDTSLAYRHEGTTCDVIAVRMQTPARASFLASAARQWVAAGVTQAAVQQTGREITIRSCDPGPNSPRLPDITPSAFDVLVALAQLIDGLMTDGHADFALGACVSDDVIAQLGPSGYSELLASSLSATQQTQLQQLVENAAIGCEDSGIN